MYGLKRFIAVLAAVFAMIMALLSAGCGDSKNYAGVPNIGPSNLIFSVPTGMRGGVDAGWSVIWIGNHGPFTVVWDFGNGANPNTATHTASANTDAVTVAMVNPSATENAPYTVTVTITDSQGRSNSASNTYTVAPAAAGNHAPVIESAVYTEATRTLVVTATDPDPNPEITISLTVPAEFLVAPGITATGTTSPFTATFTFAAQNFLEGGTGATTVTAEDQYGATDTANVSIAVVVVPVLGDALYVLPYTNTAAVADQVAIIVATGVPASPFQYMTGVSVTYPDWVHFVGGSFNVGATGGEADKPDGLWGPDGMDVDGFLVAFDFWPGDEVADLGIAGRHRYQFDLVPIGGHDLTTAAGALFNFQVSFDHAGTASFGFVEETGTINRTYYRDGSNTDHFWGQLMAGPDGTLNPSLTGLDNTIVVE
jgi:hypothetical protein